MNEGIISEMQCKNVQYKGLSIFLSLLCFFYCGEFENLKIRQLFEKQNENLKKKTNLHSHVMIT